MTNLVAELGELDAKVDMLLAADVCTPEVGNCSAKMKELSGEGKALLAKVRGHIELWQDE